LSGNEGWCRRAKRREVSARISVSRFSGAVSRTRRISLAEMREKTSSAVSGRDQNYTDDDIR